MKNTLSITSNCVCACVDSVADGTNRIFAAYEVGNVTGAVLKIWKNGTLHSTTNLTSNTINYIEIPSALFTANAIITFQYLDSGYTCQTFTINFPASLEGSLTVSKNSERVYTAKYTVSGVKYDTALSTTSENAVQNKVVTAKLKESVKGSTTFKSASGSSSSVPSVDISDIPVLTKLHIEVGVAIDTSGTVAYFTTEIIKPSKNYLYQIGGHHYSANYNGSLFINVSDQRVTINESWSKIIGGSGAATVPLKASTTKLYVYTENL